MASCPGPIREGAFSGTQHEGEPIFPRISRLLALLAFHYEYVYPESRTVEVYTAADRPTVLGEKDVLKGGDVLPGFELSLEELFAEPSEK